jgi:Uma2 family endonuclease
MSIHIESLFDTPARARLSAEDYIASPQSAHKSDLIEGVFVMASPASVEHEDVQYFIGTTMRNFVTARRLGLVAGPNMAYRLSDDNVYQPDVSFLHGDRLHLAGEVYVYGAPDLAVEIISPSSRRYDAFEKRINYARAGVREYWLVDPIERSVAIYTLEGDQFVRAPQPDNQLHSHVLAGYWLQLDWIFPPAGSPRPGELDVARAQGLI